MEAYEGFSTPICEEQDNKKREREHVRKDFIISTTIWSKYLNRKKTLLSF